MNLKDKIKKEFLAGKMSEEEAFASVMAISSAEIARAEIKNWVTLKRMLTKNNDVVS